MIAVPSSELVRLAGLNFGYGGAPLLCDVSLDVPAGKFLTLLGPSGCGKTTLLKLIGGYLKPQSGSILLRGKDVTHTPPEERGIGMVFQNYALFPHLSARRNVSFSLDVRGVAKSERDDRVERMLDLVGLTKFERDRLPALLSGGQQQRVALARALVFRPDLLLLDEPLANLDRHLRDQLRNELRRLQEETGVTAVMVTHDQEEAMAISDFVGVMNEGKLLQIGSPKEIYYRPASPFVARFMGPANIFSADFPGASREKPLMIRPEQVVLGEAADHCSWSVPATILSVSFLGPDMMVQVTTNGGLSLMVRVRSCDSIVHGKGIGPGQEIRVGIPSHELWQIPGSDGEGIST